MNINETIRETLKKQRDTVVIEPIHKDIEPVKAYVNYITELKGEPFCVVNIPKGSAAYLMGNRFASIPLTELEYYIENGASLAA